MPQIARRFRVGFYVNPPNESKEAFLARYGVGISGRTIEWDEVPKGCLPVVLVDNGPFTGAGIAFSPAELREFTRPDDRRPRRIFIVEVRDLLPVAGSGFRQWVKESGLA